MKIRIILNWLFAVAALCFIILFVVSGVDTANDHYGPVGIHLLKMGLFFALCVASIIGEFLSCPLEHWQKMEETREKIYGDQG